jgi:hypothetical protein
MEAYCGTIAKFCIRWSVLKISRIRRSFARDLIKFHNLDIGGRLAAESESNTVPLNMVKI